MELSTIYHLHCSQPLSSPDHQFLYKMSIFIVYAAKMTFVPELEDIMLFML